MAQQYKNEPEYDYETQLDPDQDWVCVEHILDVYSEHDPVPAQETFSSQQRRLPANDSYAAAQAHTLSMDLRTLPLLENALPSYPSSVDSIRAPDGPERKAPPNRFLAVAPATGLGEPQHRRRASFDEMEDQINYYSLSRWATTMPPPPPPPDPPCRTSIERLPGGWLRQDTHIVAPPPESARATRATRGKNSGSGSRSRSGFMSSASGGRVSSGMGSSKMTSLAEVGSWVGDSASGGWSMQIDDDAMEDDEDEDADD